MTSSLPVLFAAQALADTPSATALVTRLADPHYASSDIAVSCAPASTLLEKLHQHGDDAASLAESSSEALGFIAMLEPSAAAAAGLDLSGAVSAGYWELNKGIWLSIPFSGTPSAAEAMLASSPLGAPKIEADGWVFEDGSHGVLADGAILLRRNAPQDLGSEPPRAGLFSGLPDRAGCLGWVRLPTTVAQRAPELAGAELLAQVPFDDDRVLLRLATANPAPDALSRSAAAPVGGSSVERPTALAGLGIAPWALIEAIGRPIPGVNPQDLEKLKRRLNVGPGLTAAWFGAPTGAHVDWVVVAPIEGSHSPRRLARRTRKLLDKVDFEVEREGEHGFVATRGEQVVHAAARDGRLVFGARADRVADAADGIGQSWLVGAPLDRLQSWPAVVWTSALPGPDGEPLVLDIGVRSVDGIWEIEAHAELPEGAGMDGLIRGLKGRR